MIFRWNQLTLADNGDTMNLFRDILEPAFSDIAFGISELLNKVSMYSQLESTNRRRLTWWCCSVFVAIILAAIWKTKSIDFILGGLLAVLAVFWGADHAGKLQTKRDKEQLCVDIAALRKAILSEPTNLGQTYKEDVGNEVELCNAMTTPYLPKRDHVPNLRYCPCRCGVEYRTPQLTRTWMDQ